jgi:diadenosine tetraphosphate (Ap4A) HIT family hydrolase
MNKTLFEKIAAREIPAQIVFEDDLVLAASARARPHRT